MLTIKTTGLEEYAPGGEARIRVLTIGGPGAGKTRWASYFPKPIFANCEAGLASVADRRVPYVTVSTSQDMLDLLAHLKQECRQPDAQRQFQTIVIDTLDAFQRKIKDEWMERERKQVFTGWEAWGYLNSRMTLLMTRLLNLDMNVVVNVHYKDKTTKDDETGRESHQLMLQLSGEFADTTFNDFDLVGWMGTYWEPVDGERVQKRGITFKPTPDKPFLKDRLHVTPPWMEVEFEPADYENLFSAIQAKANELEPGTIVGEIVSETPSNATNSLVVAPGMAGNGALSGAAETVAKLGYQAMDKPTLIKLARDREITTCVDGTPIKGNTLKSELIAALEAHDAAGATTPAPTPAASEPGPAPEQRAEPAPAQPVANAARTQLATVAEGVVDTKTGELVESPPAEDTEGEKRSDAMSAQRVVEQHLGGQVVEDKAVPVPASIAPEQEEPPKVVCEDCGKDLTDEDPDIVKLSWIKFRKRLCTDDFQKRKTNR